VHRLLFPGLIVVLGGAAWAGETAPRSGAPAPATVHLAQVPDAAVLEAEGARIGRIQVHASDIFNAQEPGENFFLFRLANRLHRITREEVILRTLLLRPGDLYSRREVAESERLLRARHYFYDATIRVVGYDGQTVDLEVDTRDIWSLKSGLSFHRSGGANTTSAKVQDTNLLGTGKQLEASWETNVDRTTVAANYGDPSLFGSRVRLDLAYGNASDGSKQTLALQRPFFSLATRWAAGIRASSEERIDSLYDLGEITDRFSHRLRQASLWGGRRIAGSERRAQRLRAGLDFSDHQFSATPADSTHTGATFATPAGRRVVEPWVGWDWLEDNFVSLHDFDKIERTEDVNLGAEVTTRLGWSSRGLGSTHEGPTFNLAYTDGWKLGERQLLFAGAGVAGRYHGSGAESTLGSLDLRYYWSDFNRGRLLLALRFDAAHRLDPERQLLLGGDSGLRGYPLRYQQGDRRLLWTLEQRFYDTHEWFHLLRAGAAVFADIGKAWYADPDPGRGGVQLGTLRDLGVGLRFSSSRSSHGSMVRVDVAFPLDGDRGVQYLVTTSETF